MTSPRISVVICAYTEKRWDQTLSAVESVRRQSRESLEIILVVDHNRAHFLPNASALSRLLRTFSPRQLFLEVLKVS